MTLQRFNTIFVRFCANFLHFTFIKFTVIRPWSYKPSQFMEEFRPFHTYKTWSCSHEIPISENVTSGRSRISRRGTPTYNEPTFPKIYQHKRISNLRGPLAVSSVGFILNESASLARWHRHI